MGSPLRSFEADIGANAYDMSFLDGEVDCMTDVDRDYVSNILEHCDDASSAGVCSSSRQQGRLQDRRSSERSYGVVPLMPSPPLPRSSIEQQGAENGRLARSRPEARQPGCGQRVPAAAAGHDGASFSAAESSAELQLASQQLGIEEYALCRSSSSGPQSKTRPHPLVRLRNDAGLAAAPNDAYSGCDSSCQEEWHTTLDGDSDFSASENEAGGCGVPGIISWWEEPLTGDPAFEPDERFRSILTGSFHHLSLDSQSAFTSRLQFYRTPHDARRFFKGQTKACREQYSEQFCDHGEQLNCAGSSVAYAKATKSPFKQRWKSLKSGNKSRPVPDLSSASERHVGSTSAVLNRLRGQTTARRVKLARKQERRSKRRLQQEFEAASASRRAQPLPESNVGSVLLRKLGWSPGTGLGASRDGIRVPVTVERQPGRSGLGYRMALLCPMVAAAAMPLGSVSSAAPEPSTLIVASVVPVASAFECGRE